MAEVLPDSLEMALQCVSVRDQFPCVLYKSSMAQKLQ